MTNQKEDNTLTIAIVNIHGQSGLKQPKQMQIQTFLKQHKINIIHLQEINILEDSFKNCNFINSNYNILQNNSPTKYGTASLIKSDLDIDNVVCDSEGRALLFDVGNLMLGNLYLQSGTDAKSHTSRENYSSEIIPSLLTHAKPSGCIGGDLNCITDKRDATKNPKAKISPCLRRLIKTFEWQDCFRKLHPKDEIFSRYYANI